MIIRTANSALWALVLVNFIWGVGFVVVDNAIDVMPVSIFNAFRFGFAALALIPLWLLSEKSTKKAGKSNGDDRAECSITALLINGFGLGLLLFLGFSTQTSGMLYTSVSNTGFITGMCVPLVPIIGLLLFRTHVGAAVWLSVMVSSVGLYFLTIGDQLELNVGDILVAIGALCYACHITLMARFGGKFPVVALSIVQLGAVAIYSTVTAVAQWLTGDLVINVPLIEQLSDSGVIAAIAYSAILSSAFAYWAQTASQRLLEPHKVALIFALEPIFAHVAAVVFLGEHLGGKGWFGASLIIAGMLLSELGGRKKIKIQVLDQMAAPLEK